jgi:hypothetical protein
MEDALGPALKTEQDVAVVIQQTAIDETGEVGGQS